MGFASFFLCLAYLTTAILQAYGKIYIPIYTMLAGGLVKITVNLILVANPRINIIGAPIGVIACYAVICVLNLIAIVRLMPKMPSFGKIFGRPLVASAFMGAAAYFTYRLLSSILEGRLSSSVRLTEAAAMLIAIGVGMIVYLILVVALGIIGKEDVGLMPKGEKLVRLFRLR